MRIAVLIKLHEPLVQLAQAIIKSMVCVALITFLKYSTIAADASYPTNDETIIQVETDFQELSKSSNKHLFDTNYAELKRPASTGYIVESFDLINQQGFADLKKRAAKGDVNAQYEVGARYEEGEGVDENPTQAFKWLQIAADHGNTQAERRVGEMLVSRTEATMNLKEGLNWLNKAATHGDAQAQVDLGVNYLQGKIVQRSEAEAFKWLMAAARQGEPSAERGVGAMYLQGQGTTMNLQNGIEWLKRACAQGEPQALFDLGLLYFKGDGVPQDAKLAISYFVKSAMRGNLEAQVYLGLAYVTGNGVPKDIKFGMSLFEIAAKAGNADAEDNYGKGHWMGIEEEPDYQKAFIWISKAADQGLASAEYEVGIMYQQGLGVPKNDIKALKWFYLADAQGDREAHFPKEELLISLDPPQIKQAKQLADAFKPKTEYLYSIDSSKVIVCPMSQDFQIPVTMFGKTNQLLVDTGSSFMCLDDKYEPKFGEPLAQDTIGVAFGPDINMMIYRCPSILIENTQLDGYWTTCNDFTKFSLVTGEPCDGLLGMDFVKNYAIYFNRSERIFSIGDSVPEWIKKSAQAIPIKKMMDPINTFSVDARINGMETVHLLVDSGSDGTITLSEHDWKQIFSNGTTNVFTKHFGKIGKQILNGTIIRLQNVVIGTNCYSDLIAELVPGTAKSSVGQGFIRRYVLAIDFPNQVLYLQQSSEFTNADSVQDVNEKYRR